MGDVQPTINSSFHGSEDASTCRGSCQTNIQETTECTGFTVNVFHIVSVPINLSLSLVDSIQMKLLKYL